MSLAKAKTNKPQIFIEFSTRKERNRVLSQDTNLKGTNVFISEHLTHNNAELVRLARHYKKLILILILINSIH